MNSSHEISTTEIKVPGEMESAVSGVQGVQGVREIQGVQGSIGLGMGQSVGLGDGSGSCRRRGNKMRRKKGRFGRWGFWVGVGMVVVLAFLVVWQEFNLESKRKQLEQLRNNSEKLQDQSTPSPTPILPPIQKTNLPKSSQTLQKTLEKQLHYKQIKFPSHPQTPNSKTDPSNKLSIGQQYKHGKYAEKRGLNVEDFYQRLAIDLIDYQNQKLKEKEKGEGQEKGQEQEQGDGRGHIEEKILEVEYAKAQKKYNLDKFPKQLPICIFIEDDGTITQDNIQLLDSLQIQNYTNFHIILIQQPQSPQQITHLLQTSKSHLNLQSKTRIIQNTKKQGTTLNLFFHGQKFCNPNDIVLPLLLNSQLIGRQGLKILNALYQGLEIFYVRAPVMYGRGSVYGVREPWEELAGDWRFFRRGGRIGSFRRGLLDGVGVQELMHYRYEGKAKGKGKGKEERDLRELFFQSDFSVFPLYARFEEIAKGKGYDMQWYIEVNYGIQPSCQKAHQQLIDLRKKSKKPIVQSSPSTPATTQPIPSIHPTAVQPQNENSLWLEILQSEKTLQSCIESHRHRSSLNLKNTVRVVYGDKIYKKTIFNEKAADLPFGRNPIYQIDLKKHLKQIPNDLQSFKSQNPSQPQPQPTYILPPIQLQSLIRSQSIPFNSLKYQLDSQLAFQLLEFRPDPTIPMDIPLLKMEAFKDNFQAQAQAYLNTRLKQINNGVPDKGDTWYQLAHRMQVFPDDQEIIEAQYYYINHKFNGEIAKQKKEDQLPICVISMQRNIKTKKSGSGTSFLYETYFAHLETLNYTNYHIVYIDDASTDGSAEFIYNYIAKSEMKVKNRIKIIKMLQPVGRTANLYFWPQKMCRPEEIVVIVNADENILGRQSFRVFNHLYRGGDGEIWYALSRRLLWFRKFLRKTGRDYGNRRAYVRVTDEWGMADTRTFRAKLMTAVPFYQFIELHYDPNSYMAWPAFQDYSGQGVQVSAHVQLSGSSRIAHFEGLTYAITGDIYQGCDATLQKYDWRKTMSRSRLQVLDSLDEEGKLTEGEPFQTQYYRDAMDLSRELAEKNCFPK